MKATPPPDATLIFERCELCRDRIESCESCVEKCKNALADHFPPQPPYVGAIRTLVASHVGILGGMCLIVGISRSDFIELAGVAWDEAFNATKEEG